MLQTKDVTQLLIDWNNGDREAYNQLIPLVYDELRTIARRLMKHPGNAANPFRQPTSLVHEAYERLVDGHRIQWQNRAHFYGIAGRTIRHIIIDEYRERHRDKRGGDWQRVSLAVAQDMTHLPNVDLLALDAALENLEAWDERKAQMVELRFFSGLTNREISEVLNISEKTVEREWRSARAWLYRELTKGAEG